jgi:hypothetical protein
VCVVVVVDDDDDVVCCCCSLVCVVNRCTPDLHLLHNSVPGGEVECDDGGGDFFALRLFCAFLRLQQTTRLSRRLLPVEAAICTRKGVVGARKILGEVRVNSLILR